MPTPYNQSGAVAGLMLALSWLKRRSLVAQGKRRYDAKQKGFGGQTKPIFRKKVIAPLPLSITSHDHKVSWCEIVWHHSRIHSYILFSTFIITTFCRLCFGKSSASVDHLFSVHLCAGAEEGHWTPLAAVLGDISRNHEDSIKA